MDSKNIFIAAQRILKYTKTVFNILKAIRMNRKVKNIKKVELQDFGYLVEGFDI